MTTVRVQADVPVETSVNFHEAVNQDIAEFDKQFQSLGNQPLVKSEIAILKTYLAFKLGLVKPQ